MIKAATLKQAVSGLALIFLMFFLVGAITSVVQAATASQFTKKLTNPSDVTAGGVGGKIDLHLKNVQGIAIVKENLMAAYFSKSLDANDDDVFKTNSSMKLKITKGRDSGYCQIPASANGRIQVVIAGRVMFDKPTTQACSKFIGATINFPNNVEMINRDASGFFKANIEVRFTGDPKTPAQMGGNTDGYSLNYVMELDDSYGTKSKLALRGNTDSDQFGFRSSYRSNPPANRQVKAGVVFGFPCNTRPADLSNAQRSVKLYDPDAVFGLTYIWIEKNSRPIDRSDYDTGLNNNIRPGSWDSTNKRWTVQPGNRTTATVGLKPNGSAIDVTAEYRLMVLNTGKDADGSNSGASPHFNTLSLSIPFDSIYGADKCNYDLKPYVNPPTSAKSTVTKGTPINVRGHVKVASGYDDDNHIWQLTAKVYDSMPATLSGANSNQDPCSWRGGACDVILDGIKNGGFGTDTFHRPAGGSSSYSTSSLDAGDVVCFVMSVRKPAYNSQNTRWRHSDMKCVGIRANTNGTTIETATDDTYSYYPKFDVISTIENEGGNPKKDTFMSRDYIRNEYEWKMMEAKFSRKPSSIGTVDRGGCNTVQEVGGFLDASCRVIEEGDNLFPAGGGSGTKTITGSSRQTGPDPIGTWTCYTFSYLTNPKPLDSLMRDIDLYYDDWNDLNNNSRRPSRWSDGYYRYWVPAVRDDDGNVVTPGYWQYVGSPKSNAERNATKRAFREDNPDSTEPKYKFTAYRRDSCSLAGIDPKVQIRGNDLKVGGGIDTYLRTMAVGNAVGSYGSSAEYGVLSGGVNRFMASGSGLLRGSSVADQNSWSKLTFTNTDPSAFGVFNGVPPTNQPALTGATVYPDGTAFPTRAYTKGARLVLEVQGTLRITGNLTYPNSYDRISEVPRVVIKADNIQIDPGVTRIDPWLIASNISTCGSPESHGAEWGNTSSEALDDANLRIGECNNPLLFNGPVYASNIYLYRTGGSRVFKSDLRDSWANPDSGIDPNDYCEGGDCGNGSPGRRYALSAPAEVFNLRADAFLSSFAGAKTGGPVATTDKVTELPPRF